MRFNKNNTQKIFGLAFAIFPKRMDDGQVVWLEWYKWHCMTGAHNNYEIFPCLFSKLETLDKK